MMPVATLTEADALAEAEHAELRELEADIAEGVGAFVKTGRALARVRDGRLYRETHETFEAYCHERWGLRREVADRYVRASQVVDAVNPNGLADAPTPGTESVAREMAALLADPDELRDVWAGVVEQHGVKATAEQVRDRVRGPRATLAPAPVLRGPDETAEALDTDPRYLSVEDGVAVLDLLPAADRIVWPVEAFDVANVDKAMAWMDKEWPLIRASWRAHKAALKKTSGKLRAVT